MRIGDELGIPPQILRNFKANWSHQADPLNFIREVFVEWKKRECSPYNWKTVLMALSSKSIGERAMALSLAETLRREKTVQQTKRVQQQSQKVSRKQQKQRSEESSGSNEDEPQAKRMEGDQPALGVSSSSSGVSSCELLSCIHSCAVFSLCVW